MGYDYIDKNGKRVRFKASLSVLSGKRWSTSMLLMGDEALSAKYDKAKKKRWMDGEISH